MSGMNTINSFFKRLFLFSSPFVLLLVVYIISDPFKVLYKYENYNGDTYIYKNRDFISTEMYLKNSKIYIYDSFIFGSSTVVAYPPSIWGKYINTKNNIFTFDAAGENIVGIWSKIKYIHNAHHPIKNALIIMDTEITFSKFNNRGHIFMKHYKIYPSSRFNFHFESFKSFINLKFLIALAHYKISKHFYSYMTNVLDDRSFYYDLVSNEEHFVGPINELKTDSINYYLRRKGLFITRGNNPPEINSQIDEDHIQMLKEINEIFTNDSTNFKIVITPLYNQVAFNKNDLRILQKTFGENNVSDFSGINKYTEAMSNFYDNNHCKKYVGDEILNRIYY
jgi:hypothetical protein